MRRSGRLRRRTPLGRRVGLVRISPAWRRARAAWQVARFAAYVRSGGWCEVCGTALSRDAYEAHHRLRRGQGGTDALANLLACCPGLSGCHSRIHANPEWALANGWLVSSWGDPEREPVLVATRGVVLLTPQGYGRCVA